MKRIELKRIDESNFIECFNLKLKPEQERYVSHPVRSLAQAYVYYHQCTPFGIFFEGRMVGYVMVIYDYDEESYHIWHLMIDEAQQHRGLGKAATQSCIDYIRTKPYGASPEIKLTCHEENAPALQLYHSLGFTPTGGHDGDEIELHLCLQ